MAVHLEELLWRLYGGLQEPGEFSTDPDAAGRRALRNAALDLLAADAHAVNRDRARRHFREAANMTDALGALNALMKLGGEDFDAAAAEFFERWKHEPLVIDKWFALQARDPGEGALGRVLGLTAHPAFDGRTPNRLRALVQTFASQNPARFHDPSGAAYRFLADQVLMVDTFNPMTAARLVEPLCGWAHYAQTLAALMREQLVRISQSPNLSKNVAELVTRALADQPPD